MLTTTLQAPCPVVHLKGELDLATGPDLTEEIGLLVGAGFRRIVVDLTGLTFLDSSGIGVIVAAAVLLQAGGKLALANPQPKVARILALSGLTGMIEVHDTVDLATLHTCGSGA